VPSHYFKRTANTSQCARAGLVSFRKIHQDGPNHGAQRLPEDDEIHPPPVSGNAENFRLGCCRSTRPVGIGGVPNGARRIASSLARARLISSSSICTGGISDSPQGFDRYEFPRQCRATIEACEYAARSRPAMATCSLSSDRSKSTKSFLVSGHATSIIRRPIGSNGRRSRPNCAGASVSGRNCGSIPQDSIS